MGGVAANSKHGDRNRKLRAHVLGCKQREWSGGTGEAFNVKGPPRSNTLPPARLPHLNLSQQLHQLGSKCSIAQNYGLFLIQAI